MMPLVVVGRSGPRSTEERCSSAAACCRTQFGRAPGEHVVGSRHGGHARVLRAQLGRGPVCAVGSKPQAPSPEPRDAEKERACDDKERAGRRRHAMRSPWCAWRRSDGPRTLEAREVGWLVKTWMLILLVAKIKPLPS